MLVCGWVAEQGGGFGVVNKDLFCYCKRRLRVVPHFSSGRVELSCFYKKVEIIDFATLSNLLFKYRICHENKQFLSSFEMCCFICFHLKVDFSVQRCTAREQVCCDFMLFHWWSRALSSKNALKIFPIQVYKFSFLITSNIYRFNSN